MTFLSAEIAASVSRHVFSYLFLIIIFGLFALTSLSVISSCSHIGLGVCARVCVYICVCVYECVFVCVCVCVCGCLCAC